MGCQGSGQCQDSRISRYQLPGQLPGYGGLIECLPTMQRSSRTSGSRPTACSITLRYRARTWWGSRTATRLPMSRCGAAPEPPLLPGPLMRMKQPAPCRLLGPCTPLTCARQSCPAANPAVHRPTFPAPHPLSFPLPPCFFSPPQVCGSAQYVDDIKLPADALVAALVMSAKPHAQVLCVDTSAAAAMPGVAGIFSGENNC